jgi:hypothetical protein
LADEFYYSLTVIVFIFQNFIESDEQFVKSQIIFYDKPVWIYVFNDCVDFRLKLW